MGGAHFSQRSRIGRVSNSVSVGNFSMFSFILSKKATESLAEEVTRESMPHREATSSMAVQYS